MRRTIAACAQSGLVTTVLFGWLSVGVMLPVQAKVSNPGERFTHRYPEKVVDAYLNACGSQGTDRISQATMQEICVCTIEEFQNEFSLKEFRDIGQAISEERDVPPAMNRIMSDCVRQVILQPNV